MLTNISMKNFKAFAEETLELGPLCILTGLNSSGKSSVIQALRLVNEGKTLAGLGPLREYIRGESSEACITCTKKSKNGDNELQFSFNRTSSVVSSNNKRISDIVSYISADRYGPRNVLPINTDGDTQTVGC